MLTRQKSTSSYVPREVPTEVHIFGRKSSNCHSGLDSDRVKWAKFSDWQIVHPGLGTRVEFLTVYESRAFSCRKCIIIIFKPILFHTFWKSAAASFLTSQGASAPSFLCQVAVVVVSNIHSPTPSESTTNRRESLGHVLPQVRWSRSSRAVAAAGRLFSPLRSCPQLPRRERNVSTFCDPTKKNQKKPEPPKKIIKQNMSVPMSANVFAALDTKKKKKSKVREIYSYACVRSELSERSSKTGAPRRAHRARGGRGLR